MKLLVIDDHVIVRQGVSRLLGSIPNLELTEAANAKDGLTAFRQVKPDIVVLDINLGEGSGLELLRRLRLDSPDARVVVFSMYSDVAYAASARSAGALGYVAKSAPAEELRTAVERAAKGEPFVDSVTQAGMELAAMVPGDPVAALSQRELEILRLFADGRSLSDIAAILGVAYKTIANTATRIKEKLGVERTSDLIRFAIENRQHGPTDYSD